MAFRALRRLVFAAILTAICAIAVPAVTHAADPALNNTYSLGSVKLNKNGTAKISVAVPLAGIVAIGQNDEHKGYEARLAAAGTTTMKLKPRGALLKHLKKSGKAQVKFNISFTPDGGTTNTESHVLTLKYAKKH